MGHIENDASNNSSIVFVFVTGSNISTEPLPSNDKGIFIEPLSSNDRGIFIELLPNNDKGDTHAHRQQRDLISLLLFFQNKGSRLKRCEHFVDSFSLACVYCVILPLLLPGSYVLLAHWCEQPRFVFLSVKQLVIFLRYVTQSLPHRISFLLLIFFMEHNFSLLPSTP
jgi:hypothetical protein